MVQKLFTLVLSLILPSLSIAANPPTICQTTTKDHLFVLEQIGSDVEARLEDKQFYGIGKIKAPSEGTYAVSTKQLNTMHVHKISLQDLMMKERISMELALAMVMYRAEAVDKDMIYPLARQLIDGLQCK